MGEITGTGQAVSGLGGAAGYGEIALARADSGVSQVDVSAVFEDGFLLGGVHYAADALHISTDGLISFGAGVSGVQADLSAITAPFFAIFHADVDTRLDGEGAESGGIWLDVDPEADCVTITWDHVGFYRRNATLLNTFQIQLFDRGDGGFELVFRYDNINWTSGDLEGGFGGLGGLAALAGLWDGGDGGPDLLPASADEAALLDLADTLGNSGTAGLWLWDFTLPLVITGTERRDDLAGTARRDVMLGLEGNDVLRGSAGADVMNGGNGIDRVDYGQADAPIRLDLEAPSGNQGQAAGDSFLSVECFAGSAFADTLIGGADTVWFLGQGGDDVMTGGAGYDRLRGGGGRDQLDGGIGANLLSGGAGDDRLQAAQGNDTLKGGGGEDRLASGDGDDLLRGGTGNDDLSGGKGCDTIYGGDGNDSLSGGVDEDMLVGGAGDDLLMGGTGHDTLIGGPGADRFSHMGSGPEGTDVIQDFAHAQGDILWIGLPEATRADFLVETLMLEGMGRADVAELRVTHIASGRHLWTIVDGADLAHVLLQSSMNSFDLL